MVKEVTMVTKDSMDVLELLRKKDEDVDMDFVRDALKVVVQATMDAEVSAQIGAEHGERRQSRLTRPNGHRSRGWGRRMGSIELQIPKRRSHPTLPQYVPWVMRDPGSPSPILFALGYA